MIEKNYTITGMTCGSCAMKIEKKMNELLDDTEIFVDFSKKRLSIKSEKSHSIQSLEKYLKEVGNYTIKEEIESSKHKSNIHSILHWAILGALGITIIFYLIQALGMQSFNAPYYFMTDKWYLVSPLILAFSIQVGLFRAIHLKVKHGGGGTLVASGGVSTGTMLACCAHNLVLLFPVLGLSGAAVFLAAYQNQVFLVSILIAYSGVGYMWYKYNSLNH